MTELNLTTFRHILQHSLMPWLAENQDMQKFNVLTRRISNAPGEKGNYFSLLQSAFKQTGIEIPVGLASEWAYLSTLPTAANREALRAIFGIPLSRNKQYEFYLRMITETTCAYWATMESYASWNLSADLLKSAVSNILKSCRDLMEQTALLLTQKEEYRDILTVLLTALKIVFLETGILHRGYYEKHLIYLNDEEICSFGSDAMDESQQSRDKNNIAGRFASYHHNRMTDRMSGGEGKKNKDKHFLASEPALPQLMGTGEAEENWRKFVELSAGNADIAVESLEEPTEREVQPVTAIATATGEDPFISREEVMRLLGIGKTKLWNMSRNGEIPCFEITGRYKYRRSEIKSYLQSLRKNTDKT
jgi:predicted DNA-binding transcriptional regulator AlpA